MIYSSRRESLRRRVAKAFLVNVSMSRNGTMFDRGIGVKIWTRLCFSSELLGR